MGKGGKFKRRVEEATILYCGFVRGVWDVCERKRGMDGGSWRGREKGTG